MKLLEYHRMLRILLLLSCTRAAPLVRRTSSFLDVTQQQQPTLVASSASYSSAASVTSWDYDTQGQSWTLGSCSSTSGQSPVNISTTVAAQPPDSDKLFYNYRIYHRPVTMTNDGKVLSIPVANVNGSAGSFSMGTEFPNSLTTTYDLYKIMIHTNSEHTYNGSKVALELQLYHHKRDAILINGEPNVADMAIVAVGYQESISEASPFLKSLIDGDVPDQRGATGVVNRNYPSQLKFSELFNPVMGAQGTQAGFWEYSGSLTQPPCTAGVRWFVRQETLNAKKATIEKFEKATKKASHGIPYNNRILQVMGTRAVFPRFAENAVGKQAFNIQPSQSFTQATLSAMANQQALQATMSANAAGSSSALANGASISQAVLQNAQVQACLATLGTYVQDLSTANTLMQTACGNMQTAQTQLQNSAGGTARLQASTNYAQYSKTCQDETARVNALTVQVTAQTTTCNNLKATVTQQLLASQGPSPAAAGAPASAR